MDRTSSKADPDALVPACGVVIIMVVSLGIGFPFAMLLLFHGTLLSTGQSTYSYIQNAQREVSSWLVPVSIGSECFVR